jgi:hypothetical protein
MGACLREGRLDTGLRAATGFAATRRLSIGEAIECVLETSSTRVDTWTIRFLKTHNHVKIPRWQFPF